jgi:hypothetical protein
MNFIFNDNVHILCLSCNVKKVGKIVRFKQKGQKQASFLAFHKCVVKGVFFVVRVTLVPVSYLSAPSAVHSYRVPGKFICRLKSLFVGWKVYSSSTNKAKIYSYSIFVQQMYWLQDKSNFQLFIEFHIKVIIFNYLWVFIIYVNIFEIYITCRGPRGCDHMVVGFTTTFAISAYHH